MTTMKTRFGGNAPGLPGLPPPAPLPGLVGAFSRRAALFGAVSATGFLGAATPRLVAAIGGIEVGSADVRLAAIADELLDIDTRANALDEEAPGYDALIERYGPLEVEMTGLPADTLAGVMAKMRASRVSAVAGCVNGIHESIMDDIARLHAAGGFV